MIAAIDSITSSKEIHAQEKATMPNTDATASSGKNPGNSSGKNAKSCNIACTRPIRNSSGLAAMPAAAASIAATFRQ